MLFVSKMLTLSFIFSAMVSLSFLSKFDVNSDAYQDYFIFNGNRTSAHLSRTNKTINLLLQSGNNFSLYQIYNTTNAFDFKWNGFMIDGKNANLVNHSGETEQLSFDSYTFLSPYLELEKEVIIEECVEAELLYQYQDINYGMFALVVLGIGLILKLDIPTLKLLSKVIKILETDPAIDMKEDDSYVEMV